MTISELASKRRSHKFMCWVLGICVGVAAELVPAMGTCRCKEDAVEGCKEVLEAGTGECKEVVDWDFNEFDCWDVTLVDLECSCLLWICSASCDKAGMLDPGG
jgi:hypothetical protein